MVDDETGDGDELQWTMPLVLRIERAAPPSATDAIEAVALACLLLLDDPRSAGEWSEQLAAWGHRARKVVRRARGKAWTDLGDLAGVTVTHRSAQVRAFPPVPNGDLPRALTKLQVGGTDLEDTTAAVEIPRDATVLWLSPHLTMTTGKAAAQAGHGALGLRRALAAEVLHDWRAAGYPLAVRRADRATWDALAREDSLKVADGGFTEVAPGSITVRMQPPK